MKNEKIILEEDSGITFHYDFVTYLKDTNAYGNNYFSRYFEWQGVCREAWFHSCIDENFLHPLGILITKQAHIDYKRETLPFQKVRGLLNVKNFKNTSFYLTFCFCDPQNQDIIFAEGYQQIVFANHARKPIRLPKEIAEKMRKYIT